MTTVVRPMDSQGVLRWLVKLASFPDAECDDGWRLTLRALGTKEAHVVGAFRDDEMVGAASYRLGQFEWLKLINIGALVKREGVGTALVNAIRERHPGVRHWCKSKSDARGFYESLGMEPGKVLGNGMRMYCDRPR